MKMIFKALIGAVAGLALDAPAAHRGGHHRRRLDLRVPDRRQMGGGL